jgi:CRP/FNR family transcriptional regulator
MYDHVLVKGIESQEGTFLAALPSDAHARLLADAMILEVQAGAAIFSSTEALLRTGVILRGLARTYLSAGDGRHLSVRFARPGAMIGSLTEDRAALSVQAVIPCTILELNRATLLELVSQDGRVGLALIAEIARRLQDTYATLANNTFGTMRERVARHLLDLASEASHGDRLVAPVTQQALADGVGTVREVVARVLREFRNEGLISTADGCIEILDPGAIASVVRRSRSNDWYAGPASR